MYILQLICCFNRFHMYITYRMDQISRFNLWVFRLRHFGRQEVTWSNWVTKGLRLIAFCSFIFASCLPHMCFGKCVFFRPERIYARKKSCATLQSDAVGFFAKCVILKSDVYSSRVPAQVHYLLSCSAGAWVNSAHAPEICRTCVLKPLCHSAFEVPEQFHKDPSVDVQKDRISSNFSFTDLETHWCCVECIVKLCVFLNFFVTTSLSTAFNNPPYPTSFNFTIRCRIWGVECNVRLCRTSVEPVMRVMSRELYSVEVL